MSSGKDNNDNKINVALHFFFNLDKCTLAEIESKNPRIGREFCWAVRCHLHFSFNRYLLSASFVLNTAPEAVNAVVSQTGEEISNKHVNN